MASSLKIVLAVGGIFLAGAVTGGFVGARVATEKIVRQAKASSERLGPGDFGARMMEQLQLTPEQRERVKPLFAQMAEELRKVRRESFAQIGAIMARTDEALSRELTEEQQAKLKVIRAREEERRKQWMAERAKRGEGRPFEGPRPPPLERRDEP